MSAPSRHLSAAPAGAADAATLSARLLHTTRAHHGTAVRFLRGGGVREWSFPQLGGRNRSSLHWDLIKDLREGGELWVDGELVQRDGSWL